MLGGEGEVANILGDYSCDAIDDGCRIIPRHADRIQRMSRRKPCQPLMGCPLLLLRRRTGFLPCGWMSSTAFAVRRPSRVLRLLCPECSTRGCCLCSLFCFQAATPRGVSDCCPSCPWASSCRPRSCSGREPLLFLTASVPCWVNLMFCGQSQINTVCCVCTQNVDISTFLQRVAQVVTTKKTTYSTRHAHEHAPTMGA